MARSKTSMQEEPTEAPEKSCAGLDCVICYNNIDLSKKTGYMLAPCDHLFHKDCLMQWMDVKMDDHELQVVRRVDRPRPLKLSAANRLSALELSSVEDVVVMMENVCRCGVSCHMIDLNIMFSHLNARNYERQVVHGLLR